MKRTDEIKLIKLMGGKVVEFSAKMRKAFEKGKVVCPHGKEGLVRFIEYDEVIRQVDGVEKDIEDESYVSVQSEIDYDSMSIGGECGHFTCNCDKCYKEHKGGLHWFLPPDVNHEFDN